MEYMIGLMVGFTVASFAWFIAWKRAHDVAIGAQEWVKTCQAREQRLEAQFERATTGDWWKGNNE